MEACEAATIFPCLNANTEEARRVIFFARRQASEFGTPYIEAEHILLGIIQEDRWLIHQFRLNDAEMRDEIAKSFPSRERTSTSIDLPLDNASKRILAYAAEEAARLDDQRIGSEHLFLGVLREEKSLAAQLLFKRGIRIQEARITITSRNSAAKEEIVGSGESSATVGNARVIISRWIEFQDEDGLSVLGKTIALDVPRVGEEISVAGARACHKRELSLRINDASGKAHTLQDCGFGSRTPQQLHPVAKTNKLSS